MIKARFQRVRNWLRVCVSQKLISLQKVQDLLLPHTQQQANQILFITIITPRWPIPTTAETSKGNTSRADPLHLWFHNNYKYQQRLGLIQFDSETKLHYLSVEILIPQNSHIQCCQYDLVFVKQNSAHKERLFDYFVFELGLFGTLYNLEIMNDVFLEATLLRLIEWIYYTFYLKIIHNTIFQMISQPQSQLSQPHPQPLQDIINQQIQKIYLDVQKSQQHPRIQNQKNLQQSFKQNQLSEQDDSSNEKTLIKQYNKCEPALSSKTVREDLENILPEMEDNPEFDFLLPSPTELHRVIHALAAFEQIKAVFIEECKKEKLNMCQNTENFITVKKGSLNSCKCIIRMWASNEADSNVYQLRCLSRESKRLKLILVQGQQAKFNIFCLRLMKRLYGDQMIRLSTREQIQIFYSENNDGINDIKKEVQRVIGKPKKKNLNWESQSFLHQLKAQCNRLKTLLKAMPEIQFTLAYQRQFEELCFKESQIFQIYSLNYKKEYEKFQKIRESLKKQNLIDIFKQLQISEHFEQFRKRREAFRAVNKPFDSVPYMSAVKSLQQIRGLSSPGSVLQKVIVFQGKIKSSYNEYFINQMRLSDMDDYLPITIYCVLAMENEDNVYAITKMLLTYLSNEEEFEWQKKILTNLQAAFDYISNEWKEKTQQK